MTIANLTDIGTIILASHLTFHRCRPDAVKPFYATTYSACFDLTFASKTPEHPNGAPLKAYTEYNEEYQMHPTVLSSETLYEIPPRHRVLVPTGWKVQIPENSSLRIHPRSGISLKEGLTLINSEGVIDRDYDGELFVPMVNLSETYVNLRLGTRIAQGELVELRSTTFSFRENDSEFVHAFVPALKSNRRGGFGSTEEPTSQNLNPGPTNQP